MEKEEPIGGSAVLSKTRDCEVVENLKVELDALAEFAENEDERAALFNIVWRIAKGCMELDGLGNPPKSLVL